MTPAELLAASHPWKRSPRNTNAPPRTKRKPVWVCTLRERREALRLSLRNVAAALGMSLAGLHRVEKGDDVMLTTAKKLAVFYGVGVEELWVGKVANQKE